jgi:hypothetical protein
VAKATESPELRRIASCREARAMDRRSRRFVPSSEGLEGRQLLSTAPVNPITGVSANPVANAPTGVQIDGSAAAGQTIEAKRHRIQNLPFFIGLLNKDGVVPQPAVQNIQSDLDSLVGQLHQANPSLASSFNLDIRKAERYEHITPISAAALNRDFGAVLVSAGANPETVADLQTQMTQLVDFDSTKGNSTITATNDYAIVLELAVESGRPLIYPNVPSLLGSDHQGNHGKIPITHNHTPSLTGNYTIGTNIQIVDSANKVVLGQAAVDPTTGVYSVKFDRKLPDGTYTVRVRAEDSGFVSAPSPRFTFEVATPPPRK